MIQFILYNLGLIITLPFTVAYLIYRKIATKQTTQGVKEQLGIVNIRKDIKSPIWIHGVSVGETVAGAAVVEELLKQSNEHDIVFSNTTRTGHEQSLKSIKNAKQLTYYPYDFFFPVWRSIRKVKPSLFASVDTEIWPNFRFVLKRYKGKSAIINGIISNDTLKGAGFFAWLYKWTLNNIDLFCMQSEEDANRVIQLGAKPERVIITGNCKVDNARINVPTDEIKATYSSYFPNSDIDKTLVFVAGSTNPGEDIPVIEAYKSLKEKYPNLKMILAPRQIKRGEEIGDMLKERGISYNLRSNTNPIDFDNDVLILNVMGELAKAYFLGHISFVGGSLIKKGCHSILQPIAAGIGVCVGPHTFKAKDLVAQAKKWNIGFEIKNSKELADKIDEILSSHETQAQISQNCEKMLNTNKGAAEKTARAMLQLLNDGTILKL
ncbi:MAG: glycosyltransferase [Abditibacteriota bacterium]|nr:glycosyltransferase [Abditibacteriota bacterium]